MTTTATGATAHPGLVPLSHPLPPDLAERYDRDGFVVVGAALTDEQVGPLNTEVVQVLRAHLAVHEPHERSPLLRGLIHEPRVVEPLTRVIGPDVEAVQVWRTWGSR